MKRALLFLSLLYRPCFCSSPDFDGADRHRSRGHVGRHRARRDRPGRRQRHTKRRPDAGHG